MRRLVSFVLAALTLSFVAHAGNAAPPRLLVFAAASLTDVLGELSAGWTRQTGIPVELSFAASSVLARQIEAGSTADVFISADQEWMDYLAKRALIAPASRRDLVGNTLVVVAPANSAVQKMVLRRGMSFADLLGGGRLATGDPDSVPVGRYARAAFESLGVWDQVRNRLVPTDNVRSALNFVARGEVPLAVVYATDARIEKAVRIVATFPADTHPPITYPGARTAAARPEADGYLAYVAGPDATLTWKKHGFLELGR